MVNSTTEKELYNDLYDVEGRRSRNKDYLLDDLSKTSKSDSITTYPDAKMHQIVSFTKSAIRIIGYCFIPFNLEVSAILLILSEIVGIIEELV